VPPPVLPVSGRIRAAVSVNPSPLRIRRAVIFRPIRRRVVHYWKVTPAGSISTRRASFMHPVRAAVNPAKRRQRAALHSFIAAHTQSKTKRPRAVFMV